MNININITVENCEDCICKDYFSGMRVCKLIYDPGHNPIPFQGIHKKCPFKNWDSLVEFDQRPENDVYEKRDGVNTVTGNINEEAKRDVEEFMKKYKSALKNTTFIIE